MLHILINMSCVILFKFSHSSEGPVRSLQFSVTFFWWPIMVSTFLCTCRSFVYFPLLPICSSVFSIFIGLFAIFYSIIGVLYIFCIHSAYIFMHMQIHCIPFFRYMSCEYFLSVCVSSIYFLDRVFWWADVLVLRKSNLLIFKFVFWFPCPTSEIFAVPQLLKTLAHVVF